MRRSFWLLTLACSLVLDLGGCPRPEIAIEEPLGAASDARDPELAIADASTPEPEPEPEPEPPPTDDDHDGKFGADDRCPDQAETYEGTDDDDGCPDQPSRVRLSADGAQIELLEPIPWTSAWKGELAREQAVLEDLADLLRALPELHIEVRAHESAREHMYSMKPTDRQSHAIVKFLIAQGIEPERMRGVGYGDSWPIVSNSTPEGKAANDRIEVWIDPRGPS